LDDGLAAAKKALALDPTIAEAHLPLAWHLALHGRVKEAEREIETALRLNPDSWEVNKEAARIYYRQSKLEDSIRLLERSVQLAESDFHSLGMLTAAYLAQGDMERVKLCAGKMTNLIGPVLARDPDNGAALAFVALSCAALGNLERAREYIERALLLDPDNLYMRFNLAWPLLIFFKDKQGALDLLGPALARAGRNLISLAAADHNLDMLRTDPRFELMLGEAKSRVGLTTIAAAASPAAASGPLRS